MSLYASIYGIKPKGDAPFFYVGSTIKTLDQRWKQHSSLFRKGRHSTRFMNAVSRFGLENVEIILIEVIDIEDRFEREYFWIQYYLKLGHQLANGILSLKQHEKIAAVKRTSTLEENLIRMVRLVVNILLTPHVIYSPTLAADYLWTANRTSKYCGSLAEPYISLIRCVFLYNRKPVGYWIDWTQHTYPYIEFNAVHLPKYMYDSI